MLFGKFLGLGKERGAEGIHPTASASHNPYATASQEATDLTMTRPDAEGLKAFEEEPSRADAMEDILEAHEEWVASNGERGERANLEGADLTGYTRGGANLAGANLTGATLNHAKLYGAQLQGAILHKASLQHADLRGSNLNRADLSEANLIMADLGDTSMMGADLRGADMRGTNLGGADLTGAQVAGLRRSFLKY